MSPKKRLLLISADLQIWSVVRAAADRQGLETLIAGAPGQGLTHASESSPDLVLIDLGLPQLDPANLIRDLANAIRRTVRVVAFGPHVHRDRLQAAKNAGCEVMSRGELHARLEEVLAGEAVADADQRPQE